MINYEACHSLFQGSIRYNPFDTFRAQRRKKVSDSDDQVGVLPRRKEIS